MKGLMLKGDTTIDMVLQCSEKPTLTLLRKVAYEIKDSIKYFHRYRNFVYRVLMWLKHRNHVRVENQSLEQITTPKSD